MIAELHHNMRSNGVTTLRGGVGMVNIAQVIKYEGDNSTFIWKHPYEDFNTTSQLIVHESQEAIFFANGQIVDVFGAGRHTLETQNIPLLRKIINIPTGGKSSFHCEVYFINKTVQMAVKWGTDSKVRFLDSNLGIPLEIGACGEMNLAVVDSKKLLLKLVGTMRGIAWGENGIGFTKSIQNSFRPLISTAVKSHLPTAIKSNNINILEIDENLEMLSKIMLDRMIGGFEEYGLTIPQFYITNIALPENDPNFKRMKELYTVSFQTRMIQADALVRTAQADAEAGVTAARRKIEMERQLTETEVAKHEAERDLIRAQTEAQATKMAGFAEADVMRAKGYDGKDVITAEVQKAYAEGLGNMTINGGGGVAGDIIGLGVGMAAAGTVAPQLGEMFKNFAPAASTQTSEVKCEKCGAALPANAKFCLQCGEKVTTSAPADTIVCPKCGNTVVKGKFCPECGHKFVAVCPKCGKDAVTGAKFCLECGEKL